MGDIHNLGPISPREKKMYEQEYKQGAGLFEKALNQSSRSDYAPKKQQFNEVMEKAMEVLNQTARQLKREDLLEQNQRIEKDFKIYQQSPTQKHTEVLKQDLDLAKKSIEKQPEKG